MVLILSCVNSYAAVANEIVKPAASVAVAVPTILESDLKKYLTPQPTDLVFGSESAKFTVVEYFSLTCFHCALFYENVFLKLKKNFIDTGKVRWIKRSFITDGRALKASLLLECKRSEPYGYVKLLAVLLSKQDAWLTGSNFEVVLKNMGKLSGMDEQKIDQCLNNQTMKEQLIENTTIASKKLGVSATPYFFFNGEAMPKGFDFNNLEDFIEKAERKK